MSNAELLDAIRATHEMLLSAAREPNASWKWALEQSLTTLTGILAARASGVSS